MNLRQLNSLTTILQTGSFAAAGAKIGLSPAAISVQMQQLEESLQVELFDRRNRPLKLTADGVRIAALAQQALAKIDHIRVAARGNVTAGPISIGFIPTCVQYLLPRVLHALRRQFPELAVQVKSELSGSLAVAVARRELDYALLTMPLVAIPELEIIPLAAESFYVIGPGGLQDIESDAELLRAKPYIAFNRRTWVGQHIMAKLQQRGIHVDASIEIDSLEAIENLVADGFGVSIVPRRLFAKLKRKKLLQIPFGNPVETRQLALAQHVSRPASKLEAAIRQIFVDLPFRAQG